MWLLQEMSFCLIDMRVLVACEESQEVCKAFRRLGHEAYSCDLQECSGGHPEWHIVGDATKILYSQKWDLVIAHPPCTRLANSGVKWLARKKETHGYSWSEKRKLFMRDDPKIWSDLIEGANLFNAFVEYGLRGNRVVIENPIMHKYAKELIKIWKPQIIQPWMFGHGETKATCLWVLGVNDLRPTNIVEGREQRLHKLPPSKDRAKIRSKTFPGIAQAMAEQWGVFIQ